MITAMDPLSAFLMSISLFLLRINKALYSNLERLLISFLACKFGTSVVIFLLNSTVVGSTLSSSTEKLLFPVNCNFSKRISTVIGNYTKSVFKRVCSKSSPIKNLCFHLLSNYMGSGITVPGTIVDRILKLGLSPIDAKVSVTKSMTDMITF